MIKKSLATLINRVIFFLLVAIQAFGADPNIHIAGKRLYGSGDVRLWYFGDASLGITTALRSPVDTISRTFAFEFQLPKPTIVYLEDQPILVLPGDSIAVLISTLTGATALEFSGRWEEQHRFLIELRRKIGNFKVSTEYQLNPDLTHFKERADAHFRKCLQFLSDQGRISTQFRQVAKDYLTASYYTILLYPFSAAKIQSQESHQIYLEFPDSSYLRKEQLLGIRDFIMFLSYYNRYALSEEKNCCKPGQYFDSTLVAAEARSINSNFSGRVRDELMLYVFAATVRNGNSSNSDVVRKMHTYLKSRFESEPARLGEVNELMSNFDKLKKPLPESVLKQRLRMANGDLVAFRDLLGRQNVYLDFWASWCGPCIEEMKWQRELISASMGKDVKFVLISLDKDQRAWQKAMERINIQADHYLVTAGFDSDLVAYLAFNEIPRYVLLSRDGLLISRDAPRPSLLLKNRFLLNDLLGK